MNLRLFAIFAILLCFIPSIAHAQLGYNLPDYCPNPVTGAAPASAIPTVSVTQNGVALSLLALTVSFDVVAIAFIISRFFPHLGIRNWLQVEYWEITKSALIIVCIYSVITLIGSITTAIVPLSTSGVGITPMISGAETYLCQVNTQTTNTWTMFGVITGGTGFWAAFEVSFYVPIPIPPFLAILDGAWFLPFSNWLIQTGNWHISPYGSIINDLINFVLFPFTAMLLGLISVLPTFAVIGLTFFVPLGLLFRAFPFIRGLGGTLIAIGLAMAVVLPSVLLLFNYQVTALLSSVIPITQPVYMLPSSYLSHPSCVSAIGSTFTQIPLVGSQLERLICSFSGLLSNIVPAPNFIDSIYYGAHVFDTNAIYFFMNIFLNYGVYLILQLLLIVIDMVIIYSVVDSLARVLGGSIRLQLGGKLRLAS